MDKRTPTRPRQFTIIYFFAGMLSLFSSACLAAEEDPFEPFNRTVFAFNDTLDRWLLKPTAKVYQAVMPEFAERGVRNVFSNLGEVRNTVHNTLQGKLGGTLSSTSRFLINSTVGIGGLFDVATKIGISSQTEDFGQTLGVWGVNSGPYLVLPLFGPSSLRDGFSKITDPFLDPITYAPLDTAERLGVNAVEIIQLRADLLAAESLLMGDRYLLLRQAYLSKREFDVLDGRIESDDFLDNSPFDESDSETFVDEEF